MAFTVQALIALGGCAAEPRIGYTADQAKTAQVQGIPGARVFADAPAASFKPMMPATGPNQALNYLALSGGGGDGAYGAGVLNGWSASGTRPTFDIVSGVSTGALTAPFAFLGSAYDPILTEIYTSGIAGTLVKDPDLLSAVLGSGLFGDQRLRDLVGRYVTPQLLAAVAAEHQRGRRLLVITTNLDSKRAVVWNMGAIAASKSPQALALFRDVLTASASVPGVFQPQLLAVEADGRTFQELHVDGVVTTPIFTVPPAVLLGTGHDATSAGGSIYILMNGHIEPEFDVVQNSTLPIVEGTLVAGSQARTRDNLTAAYAFARAHRLRFELAYIDASAPKAAGAAQEFDTAYMRALYTFGFQRAQAGRVWEARIPTEAAARAGTLVAR